MKTAISLPDAIFEEAELVARQLGLSRSELYVSALHDYLEKFNREQRRLALNEVYSQGESAIDPDLAAMQLATLAKEDW